MKHLITIGMILGFCQFSFGIDLLLNYSKDKSITKYSKTELILWLPNNEEVILINDTISDLKDNIKNIDFKAGNCILEITHIIETDTINIDYKFEITGKEKRYEIDLFLHDNIKQEWKNNSWEIIEHYYSNRLTLILIYPNSDTVIIEPILEPKIGEKPVFRVINNSNTEIKGEFMSGYFWGYMERYINENWFLRRTGIIDMNFVYKAPLSHNDTTITHVGSFNDLMINSKGKYKYSVYYNLNSSLGNSLYKEIETFKCFASTKRYHELEYVFDIN